jgi:predicted SnoaL-like aldol condensation-catalyzing enzyme
VSKKEIATQFLRLVAAGNIREAYAKYIAPDFRHHNAYFKGDRESLKVAMEEAQQKNPHKVLDIKMALEDGDRVVIFSHVKQNPEDRGGAVVHIFRFAGNHIVEMWDLGQQIPENMPNENGMF